MMHDSDNVGLVQGGSQDTGLSTESADGGQAMRIDMLGGEPGEVAIEAPPRPKIPGYLIMLGVLIAAAGAALFGMRKVGMGSGLLADTGPQIIYDVTKGVGDVTAEHQRALASLKVDGVGPQVPVENVQKNPFVLEDMLPEQAPTTTIAAKPTKTPEEIAAEQLAKKIQTEHKKLVVQALVAGSNPVARISGSLYRVGDRISGVFAIEKITGRDVVLMGDDGNRYIIEMKTAAQSWGTGGN